MKTYLQRNLLIYYGAETLLGLRFIAPVWVLFFSHYLTFQEITWLEVLGLIVGILLELPTGVFADLFGKKLSLVLGYWIAGIGFVFIGLATNFGEFLWGYIVNGIGSAFISGASAAMLFDTLKDHNLQERYGKFAGRGVVVFRLALIVAMISGQYLYQVAIGLPYIGLGVATIIAGALYLFAREPKVDSEKFSVKNYFLGFKLGAKEAFKNSKTTKLSLYFLTIASIELVMLMFYYAPYLSWIGYTDKTIGWIYGAIALTRMLVALGTEQIEKWLGDRKLVLWLPLVLGFTLAFGFVRDFYLGTILIFIHYSLFTLRYTVLDKYTNLRFESKYRASALSTLNMIASVAYCIFVLVAGRFIGLNNTGLALTIGGVILLAIGFPLARWYLNEVDVAK